MKTPVIHGDPFSPVDWTRPIADFRRYERGDEQTRRIAHLARDGRSIDAISRQLGVKYERARRTVTALQKGGWLPADIATGKLRRGAALKKAMTADIEQAAAKRAAMPKIVGTDMREMIDRAVAAGAVTRCPTRHVGGPCIPQFYNVMVG